MSLHDNEDLVNYEDEDDVVPDRVGNNTTAGILGDAEEKKKSFSGIHSTGFRSDVYFFASKLSG